REYGLKANSIVKIASNENPLGPSPKAREAIAKAVGELHRYPDGGAWDLTHKLAERHQLKPENFIIGNGSNEVLELLAQTFLEPGTNAVMGAYPFVVYPLVTMHFGAEIRKVPMPGLRHDLEGMLAALHGILLRRLALTKLRCSVVMAVKPVCSPEPLIINWRMYRSPH
ncbi:MAG: hypothetical protein P8X79_13210, partial [Reinekea sp.]